MIESNSHKKVGTVIELNCTFDFKLLIFKKLVFEKLQKNNCIHPVEMASDALGDVSFKRVAKDY